VRLQAAKLTVLRTLRALGGFGLVAGSGWRRRRLLILCYHGFSLRDEHRWNPDLYVTGEHFERRLRALAEGGYEIVPLGQGLTRLGAGTLPPKAVAITVDDGMFDFFRIAYPTLCRLRTPVTLYASTWYVMHPGPVFPVMVAYLLWRGMENRIGATRMAGLDLDLAVGSRAKIETTERVIFRRAKEEAWSGGQKEACLADLAALMGEEWDGLRRSRLLNLMTPEEIGALDPGIVDVQLHTHRHRTPRDRELFLRELRDNRAALESCGLDPARLAHLCYPSGEHHPEFLPWLREAGVVSATTCVPGLAAPDTDPLLLPRVIDTNRTPDIEFEAWSAGVREVLRRPHRQYSSSH
jgi:peptidoglycan/xylan/chitin deacetylase (PgdA/CDA1 family)